MKENKISRIESIIDSAISEFIEKGYEGASMESIAARANLSKGGLYHHFKSKSEILYAVNVKFQEPVTEFINRMAMQGSVIESLLGFIEEYLNYWNQHRRELILYFMTMNEALGNPIILKSYRDSTKETFGFFREQFEKGWQQGVLKNCDAYARAVSMISCMDGYLGYLLIDPELKPERIIQEIQSVFIGSLIK